MCRVFFEQPPESYEPVKRSIRIQGQVTSLSLERQFWNILEKVAESQGMSLSIFIATLYEEALNYHGEVRNFTSLLRSACVIYLQTIRD